MMSSWRRAKARILAWRPSPGGPRHRVRPITLRRSMSGPPYTRRRLIQAGTGSAAAAGLATALPVEAKQRRRRRADVVVVGAGYAGLTAAHRIAAAGKSVIVMEARHRVGGRAHNHKLPGGK